MTSKEEECVRIVEALRDKMVIEGPASPLVKGLADSGFVRRIVDAVKPKVAVPLTMPHAIWKVTDAGERWLLAKRSAETNYAFSNEQMAQIVVAELKHRGIDLEELAAFAGEAHSVQEDLLKDLLDNAEAEC